MDGMELVDAAASLAVVVLGVGDFLVGCGHCWGRRDATADRVDVLLFCSSCLGRGLVEKVGEDISKINPKMFFRQPLLRQPL